MRWSVLLMGTGGALLSWQVGTAGPARPCEFPIAFQLSGNQYIACEVGGHRSLLTGGDTVLLEWVPDCPLTLNGLAVPHCGAGSSPSEAGFRETHGDVPLVRLLASSSDAWAWAAAAFEDSLSVLLSAALDLYQSHRTNEIGVEAATRDIAGFIEANPIVGDSGVEFLAILSDRAVLRVTPLGFVPLNLDLDHLSPAPLWLAAEAPQTRDSACRLANQIMESLNEGNVSVFVHKERCNRAFSGVSAQQYLDSFQTIAR